MRKILDSLWRLLVPLLPPELEAKELWLLLSAKYHNLVLSRRRATMIVNRVRLFAFLFAVLTPMWSVIDLIVFDAPLWIYLAIIRVLASVAFVGLFMFYQKAERMANAYKAMAFLFAVPTAFFIASHNLLSEQSLNNISASLATGYAFLPFVLMAGLALFPLTLKENLLISLVIMVAQAMVGYMGWTTLNWPSFFGGFWLLILIAAVVALASLSQLAFMIALVRQASQDALTGVMNRGSGEEVIGLHWAKAEHKDSDLAIAFFDLDNFKAVNDNYGHEAGDRVLCEFAKSIDANKRKQDVLLRWGGEEFVLLMPAVGIAQAEQLLQKLRSVGFGLRPDGNKLTASVGLAARLADKPDTVAGLVELADKRMYQAKNQGRDAVVAG